MEITILLTNFLQKEFLVKQNPLIICTVLLTLACNAMDTDPKDLIQKGQFAQAIPILREKFNPEDPFVDMRQEKERKILLAQALCAKSLQTGDPATYDEGRRLFALTDKHFADRTSKAATASEGLGDVFAMIYYWNMVNRERLKDGKEPVDLFLEGYRSKLLKAIVERSKEAGDVINNPKLLEDYTKVAPLISLVKARYLIGKPKAPSIVPLPKTLKKWAAQINAVRKKGKIPVAITWISGAPDDDGIEKKVLGGLSRQRSFGIAHLLTILKPVEDKVHLFVTQGPPDKILTKKEYDVLPENKKIRFQRNVVVTPTEFKNLSHSEQEQYKDCIIPTEQLEDFITPVADDDGPFEDTIAVHGLCPIALTSDTLNAWLPEAVKTGQSIDSQRTGICIIPTDPSGEGSNVDWRHMTDQSLQNGPSSRWHDRVKTFEVDVHDKKRLATISVVLKTMVEEASK